MNNHLNRCNISLDANIMNSFNVSLQRSMFGFIWSIEDAQTEQRHPCLSEIVNSSFKIVQLQNSADTFVLSQNLSLNSNARLIGYACPSISLRELLIIVETLHSRKKNCIGIILAWDDFCERYNFMTLEEAKSLWQMDARLTPQYANDDAAIVKASSFTTNFKRAARRRSSN